MLLQWCKQAHVLPSHVVVDAAQNSSPSLVSFYLLCHSLRRTSYSTEIKHPGFLSTPGPILFLKARLQAEYVLSVNSP